MEIHALPKALDEQQPAGAIFDQTHQPPEATFRGKVRPGKYELINADTLRGPGTFYQSLRFQSVQCVTYGFGWVTQKACNLLGTAENNPMTVEKIQDIPITE
jgi:hypothetical protein